MAERASCRSISLLRHGIGRSPIGAAGKRHPAASAWPRHAHPTPRTIPQIPYPRRHPRCSAGMPLARDPRRFPSSIVHSCRPPSMPVGHRHVLSGAVDARRAEPWSVRCADARGATSIAEERRRSPWTAQTSTDRADLHGPCRRRGSAQTHAGPRPSMPLGADDHPPATLRERLRGIAPLQPPPHPRESGDGQLTRRPSTLDFT